MASRTISGRITRHSLIAGLLLVACGRERGAGRTTSASVITQTPSTTAFQDAAARALPAVVAIQVEARPGGYLTPLGTSQPLADRADPRAPLVPIGSGSGVVFRDGGYILTNNHVVQEAERVTITTYDRRSFEAQVIARDPSTDIAVVQVKAEALPSAPLGDSDSLRLGQWVLALGSPLGLQFTVTAGIVSATGRSIGTLSAAPPVEGGSHAPPLEDFIQTDAAINPGNSGGPLVDLSGRVIGINSAIASPTGVFAGYGFAVPIDIARLIADELIRYGEVRRPYLGVALDAVDAADVKVYTLPGPAGAEVIRVEPEGPADRAGVQLGDVIVRIGEQPVRTVTGLQAALARLEPNSTVPIRLVRYGRDTSLNVSLGLVHSGVRPRRRPASDEPGRAGLQVVEQGGRVIIAGVQPYSTAARAGVRPGQVIVSANRQIISSIEQLVAAVRAAATRGVLSLIVEDREVGRVIINYELSP